MQGSVCADIIPYSQFYHQLQVTLTSVDVCILPSSGSHKLGIMAVALSDSLPVLMCVDSSNITLDDDDLAAEGVM